MVKEVFRVTDMHCSNCVMRIEGLEDDLPGVQREGLEAEFSVGHRVSWRCISAASPR